MTSQQTDSWVDDHLVSQSDQLVGSGSGPALCDRGCSHNLARHGVADPLRSISAIALNA